MTNGYLAFLDYLELRRRVEKWLAPGNVLLIHAFVFGIVVFLMPTFVMSSDRFRIDYIDRSYGFLVATWSGLLFIHGLWTYWHSGANKGKRDKFTEYVMRQGLENDDLYLSKNPKDLFRLHALLNNDIRTRSSMSLVLLFFSFLNALNWIPWALSDPGGPGAWWSSPSIVAPFLLALGINFWWRRRHEVRLTDQMEALFSSPSNQQFDEDNESEREGRLSEDDELVTVDEYMMKRKRN
jgi:hypothetical protein